MMIPSQPTLAVFAFVGMVTAVLGPPIYAQPAPPSVQPLPDTQEQAMNQEPIANQLANRIRAELDAAAPDALAGLMFKERMTVLEVHLTASHATYAATVDAVVAEFRHKVGQAASLPSVRVITDARNSLRLLKSTQQHVTSRVSELESRGIRLMEWGVDLRKNRMSIGVNDVTPAIRQYLEQQFDSDVVDVIESSGWVTQSRRVS